MGTKIEGIFPHHLTSYEEIERLPERLRPTLPLLAVLSRSYGQSSTADTGSFPPAWQIGLWSPPRSGLTPRQEWESGRGPLLFAPGPTIVDDGSWLVLGRRCLFVTTGIKWWFAMSQPALVHHVRDYFRGLVRVLNRGMFLLHRDNGCLSWEWVFKGMAFDEIEHEFVKRGANRVADLDALRHTGPKIEETGYYREG